MQKQTLLPRRPLKKTAETIAVFLSHPDHDVMFFDEGRFGLQPVTGRCWALKGRRQYTRVRTGYKSFYIYAGISPQTGEGFVLFLPWVNTDIMNVYMQELSRAYHNKKLMLIFDQAGWHKSKDIQIPENIQVEQLPPYSPELNPVEKLWQWLRRQVCRNRLFESEENLMNELSSALNGLSNEQLKQLCNCNYLLHYK